MPATASPAPSQSTPALSNSSNSIPSTTVEVEGKKRIILRGKFKDANAVRAGFNSMWNGDRLPSADRSVFQGMIDGDPPIDPSKHAVSGGGTTNVNWGDAERILHEETAPYTRLATADRTLFSTPLKREAGNDQERDTWSQIIAEEITDTIRASRMFAWKHGNKVQWMKRDGISYSYFSDEFDWRWEVAPMEQFKIPQDTRLDKGFKFAGVKVKLQPDELWAKIGGDAADTEEQVERENAATARGWNVPEVKKAIMDAAPSIPNTLDYEAWERYWKNNQYLMGESTAKVTEIIILWAVETDGSVSQYIVRADGSSDQFLYKREGKHENINQFCHMWIENLGTNGDMQSIRGLAKRLYSCVMEYNRKMCRFSDLVDLDTMPLLQPGSEVQTDDAAFETVSGFGILPVGWTIPSRVIPPYENSLIPALQMYKGMMQNGTSRATPSGGPQNPKTPKHVWESMMADVSMIGDQQLNLWYMTEEPFWQEVVRRITNPDYDPVLPGGREAADCRKRCFERDVPEEAFHQVDYARIRVTKSLGAGSASARRMALEMLLPYADKLDPVGQNFFWHDYYAAASNEDLANRYKPIKDNARLPDDASIAQIENNQLVDGKPVEVLDGQNDEVHAQMHLWRQKQLYDTVIGQSVNIMQVCQPMRALADHTTKHLEKADKSSPQVRQMTQIQQQFEGVIQNGEKQLARIQEAAAREAAHNDGKVGANPAEGGGEAQGQNGQAQADQQKQLMDQQQQAHDVMLNGMRAKIELEALVQKQQIAKSDRENKLAFERARGIQKIQLADMDAAAKIHRGGLES